MDDTAFFNAHFTEKNSNIAILQFSYGYEFNKTYNFGGMF